MVEDVLSSGWFQMALGALISAGVSYGFYRAASRDLREEVGALRSRSAELRDYTLMLVRFLDDAGVIEVEWKPDGTPARVVQITVSAEARGSASASARVTRTATHDAVAKPQATHEWKVIPAEKDEEGDR